VPEIASRAHSEAISWVTEKALSEASCTLADIDAVAVTNEPGLIGALLVGVNFAKSLAYGSNKPLIPVHHIKGHIASNYAYFNGKEGRALLEPPFVSLVVSGGHTSLVKVNSYTDFEVLGSTRDDAAGESFDKVARMIGLPYPGGAKMDAAAKSGNPKAFSFPDTKVKNCPFDFSFSGLKTSAVNIIHNATQKGEEINVNDMSASFTAAVVNGITSRVEYLFKNNEFCGDKLVLAGGVAANSHLREALLKLCNKYGIEFFCPPLSLCGDNAVMIGCQGYYEFINGKDKNFNDLSLNAYASSEF
jgi:N6-L-threonylcarbamoyladenine synthase